MTKEKIIKTFAAVGFILSMIVAISIGIANGLGGAWGYVLALPVMIGTGVITGIGYLIGCAVEKNSWKK